MRRVLVCIGVLSLAASAGLSAQPPVAAPAAATSVLSVFLDCQNVGCDFDFFRTEITSVNWVRDREVADVHLLVTGAGTGAGGNEFTATFIGLRQFAGLTDTLRYSLPPASTSDDQRRGLARLFRLGLVRYLARTPVADRITISVASGATGAGQTSTRADPWRAWVFSVSTGGFTYGEETYKEFGFNGNVTANRITEQWKTQFRIRQNYNEDEFEVDDTTTALNIRRNGFASLLHVRSLGDHWSVGLRAEVNSSTYDNVKRQFRASPAVEFNIFPYSETTRRRFKFEYAVGVSDATYSDTTIYDKVAETLPLHRLSMEITQRQPWGQVDVGAFATQYLHDPTKYRINTFAGASVRLFKGFRVNFDGGYDVIYDQLSLLKKDYSQQEILLRQFQRGTRYSFYGSMSVSYTFGSIFNNVVNPRFD